VEVWVELRVRLPEEPEEKVLLGLRTWLLKGRQLRGRVTLVAAEDRSGHLGGVWEAVAVALGSGGAVAVFLQTFSEWLKRRRPDTIIEISVKHGDVEKTLKFTNVELAKALELLRELDCGRQLEGGDDAAT